MGLIAAGVNALKLGGDDEVAGMVEIIKGSEIVLLSSDGKGWRVPEEGFPVQGRYGQGVITCRLNPGCRVAGITSGKKNTQISLHFKKAAAKVIRLDDVPTCNRATQGKPALEVKAGEEIERIVMGRSG